MKQRKWVYAFLTFLASAGFVFVNVSAPVKTDKLQIAFLDVGQGDAILISQGSKQILIDGGISGQKLLEKMGAYIPFDDRKIEIMIATHPDADHITGLVDVLKNYTVETVIESGAESDSQIFATLEKTIEEKKIEKQIARRGMKIKISDEAQLEILSPTDEIVANSKKDTNSASIVTKLIFGENSFLLTGDMPLEIEDKLLLENALVDVEFLKVSHHGAKTASGEEFLNRVTPRDAIISVGKNRYGHPTEEVLNRLKEDGARILRTDEMGDIIYDCMNAQSKCEAKVN